MGHDVVGKSAIGIVRADATVAEKQRTVFAHAITEARHGLPGEIRGNAEATDISDGAEKQFFSQLRTGRGEFSSTSIEFTRMPP
jgi:hypothetical protein